MSKDWTVDRTADWGVCEVSKKQEFLLLFDWDNTLVDTWGLVHESLQVALRGLGMGEWNLEETKRRLGASLRDNFPRMFGDRALEAKVLYREHFLSRHLETLRPFAEAEALLRWLSLHRERCVVGIVSNKGGDALRAEIAHLGWGEYFRAVVGAEDLVRDKPDPCCLEEIFVRLGMERGDFDTMMYVGDSVVDMEFSKRCGMEGILLGDGGEHTERFAEYGWDVWVRDFAGLRGVLAERMGLAD